MYKYKQYIFFCTSKPVFLACDIMFVTNNKVKLFITVKNEKINK